MKRYGPSPRHAQKASAALRIFVLHPKMTLATWGNSGIEPDKGKGISSPGTYEASLMWPRNDGERQWNTMSDWTTRSVGEFRPGPGLRLVRVQARKRPARLVGAPA